MLSEEYQIASSLNPAPWDGCNLLGEPRKPQWLMDIPVWILMRTDATWNEELQKMQ